MLVEFFKVGGFGRALPRLSALPMARMAQDKTRPPQPQPQASSPVVVQVPCAPKWHRRVVNSSYEHGLLFETPSSKEHVMWSASVSAKLCSVHLIKQVVAPALYARASAKLCLAQSSSCDVELVETVGGGGYIAAAVMSDLKLCAAW